MLTLGCVVNPSSDYKHLSLSGFSEYFYTEAMKSPMLKTYLKPRKYPGYGSSITFFTNYKLWNTNTSLKEKIYTLFEQFCINRMGVIREEKIPNIWARGGVDNATESVICWSPDNKPIAATWHLWNSWGSEYRYYIYSEKDLLKIYNSANEGGNNEIGNDTI